MRIPLPIFAILIASGCAEELPEVVYQTAVAERRDISVAIQAAGIIQAEAMVEIKSKASGEILEMLVDMGDHVNESDLLVRIDKRTPENQVAQERATLEAAEARLAIAEIQKKRSSDLFKSGNVNEVTYEISILEVADSKAEVIRAKVALENAQNSLQDTDIRAPMEGTIIERQVERGQVISSPTQDVGGGTPLLTMADLTSLRVRAMVDETDIGRISVGMPTNVTVSAFPDRRFRGVVHKIDPLVVTQESVTMFAAIIKIKNSRMLLLPGMNADVEIELEHKKGVVAIPLAALRLPSDTVLVAQYLDVELADVSSELDKLEQEAAQNSADPAGDSSTEEFLYREARPYWVLVQHGNEASPRPILAGTTDLDFVEVLKGLTDGEAVYLLPSAELMEEQLRVRALLSERTRLPGFGN